MTTVRIGSNEFVDCDTLIAIRGQELLRVMAAPPRVSLTTPTSLKSGRMVTVTENVVRGDATHVQTVATDKSVTILWDKLPIIVATVLDDQSVSVKVDLRPIGINLFDAGNALWIGSNQFVGNILERSRVGIQLG